MSDENNQDSSSGKKRKDEGYIPLKRVIGRASGGKVIVGGHKPEKSELKPQNPPKKK